MQTQPDAVTDVRLSYIEPGAVCSLACPLCPTGSGASKLSQGFLKASAFADILEALGPGWKKILLFRFGEPLLNPFLGEMLREASRRRIETTISTHLSLPKFDSVTAQDIVGSGVSTIIASIDGATQEVYERYRVGGSLPTVLANIRKLIRAKKAGGLKKPAILWQFLAHKENQHELHRARVLASKLGIGFYANLRHYPRSAEPLWGGARIDEKLLEAPTIVMPNSGINARTQVSSNIS